MPGNSASTLLMIAAICIILGSVVGYLFGSLRGGGEASKKVEPAVGTAFKQVIQPAPAPAPEALPALLRLDRDPEKGVLWLTLEGKQVRESDALSAEDKKRVGMLLKELVGWMGTPGVQTASQAAPVTPIVTPAPTQAAPVIPVVPLQPLPPAPASAFLPDEPESAKPSMMGGVNKALSNALSPAPMVKAKAVTMVQQIDEILQERLAGTAYEGQNIALHEGPGHSVLVNVGTTVYEGIGSVPEGEIKVILKSSVTEWERRQEEQRRRGRPR